MKKITKLIFICSLPTMLSGCKDSTTHLLGSIDYFANGSLNENTCYVEGTIDLINDLLDLQIPFITYLSEDGCSSCEKFKPIMDEWAQSNSFLILKITNKTANAINSYFDNLFCQNLADGSKQLAYPTVGIVNSSTNFDVVDNLKYMQTKRAFPNYMKKKYSASKIYFTNEDVMNKNLNKEFTYVAYKNNDESCKNLYNEKLLNNIKSSNNNIVISNYNAESLSVGKMKLNEQNKNYLDEVSNINSDTQQSSLNSYFN